MERVETESTQEPAGVIAQVTRHLLAKISEQGLRPGDGVDSEVQVSRDLKVSRGSVREAYRTLAALGVLDIGNGRRPRVHAVSTAVLAHIFGHALQIAQATPAHVHEFRRGVEVRGVQLAARFASEAQLATLRSLIEEMRASGEDEERRRAADMAIHATLAEASDNPLHVLVLGALQSAIARSVRGDYLARRGPMDIVRIISVHEAIVDAVCARDAVAAGAAMSYHFDLSVNSLVRSGASSRDEEVAVEIAST